MPPLNLIFAFLIMEQVFHPFGFNPRDNFAPFKWGKAKGNTPETCVSPKRGHMDNLELSSRSKDCIVKALLGLLEKEEFPFISVSEICKKAGVGRVTFYRHFKSKEEVVLFYLKREMESYVSSISFAPRKTADYYRIIESILSYLLKEKKAMKILLKSHLEYLYLDFLNANLAQTFLQDGRDANPFLPYTYAGSLFNVSLKWLSEDCSSPLKEVVGAIFINCFGLEEYQKLQNR